MRGEFPSGAEWPCLISRKRRDAPLTLLAGLAQRFGIMAIPMSIVFPSSREVNWQAVEVRADGGRKIEITATRARQGPANGDRGPVIGFVLTLRSEPRENIYVSGYTVWYEGVAEVAKRFPAKAVILFMGAATVKEVGPHHLTMSAEEALHVAEVFPDAPIIPVHCDGWAHFTESRDDIQDSSVKRT